MGPSVPVTLESGRTLAKAFVEKVQPRMQSGMFNANVSLRFFFINWTC